jgi:hypothetical protein
VAEVAHDLLDRVLHAVELGERGIDLDDLVGEQPGHARVVARVDHLGSPIAFSMRSAAVA